MPDKKTDAMTEAERDAHHKKRMTRKKAARDKMIAAKPISQKGLIMVNTGNGKGKTTAAMGLAIRAIGNGLPVEIIQFVKGVWSTGERSVLESFPKLCSIRAMGEGFSWDSQDRQRDIEAARKAWTQAVEAMQNPEGFLVILDEINIPLRYGHLSVEEVCAALQQKHPSLHVLLTGRNAPDALCAMADMVSEIAPLKHHFRDGGVKAQVGIEF